MHRIWHDRFRWVPWCQITISPSGAFDCKNLAQKPIISIIFSFLDISRETIWFMKYHQGEPTCWTDIVIKCSLAYFRVHFLFSLSGSIVLLLRENVPSLSLWCNWYIWKSCLHHKHLSTSRDQKILLNNVYHVFLDLNR